jgi:hypothetical protein
MYIMGEEKDMFVVLAWAKEIRGLRNPHILYNTSLENDIGAGIQYSDD